jgi:hypothetical protein
MHLGLIDILADVAELLVGSLVLLFCCLGVRTGRAGRVRWQDLVRWYPDLDRELDMIWQRYTR